MLSLDNILALYLRLDTFLNVLVYLLSDFD